MADVQLTETPFCLVEDVHAVMGRTVSAAQDNFIIPYINYFSKLMEGPKYCNRSFKKEARTEYFDGYSAVGVQHARKSIILAAPPIDMTATFEVYDDVDRLYSVETLLELNEDYTVNANAGVVKTIYWTFATAAKNIKVVYTGGLVTYDPITSALTIPEDLRWACAMQCAQWYNARHEPGAQTVAIPGGGMITMADPNKMLGPVLATLYNYRREIY